MNGVNLSRVLLMLSVIEIFDTFLAFDCLINFF